MNDYEVWVPQDDCDDCSLRSAQLQMVASELAGDSKLHWLHDRSDPRWTPALQEAWAARQKHKEDAAQIVSLIHERNSLKLFVDRLIDALRRIQTAGERCRCYDIGHKPHPCGCCAVMKEIEEVELCELGYHQPRADDTKECKWCGAVLP